MPFLDTLIARESDALNRLVDSTGGQSLCAPTGDRGSRSTVKYREGAVAALAEGRRAIRRSARTADAVGDPDDASQRLVITGIRDAWLAQSSAPGRTGPGWADYFEGGLDALARQLEQ